MRERQVKTFVCGYQAGGMANSAVCESWRGVHGGALPIIETIASPLLSEVRRGDGRHSDADPCSLFRKPVWLLVEQAGTKNPWSG